MHIDYTIQLEIVMKVRLMNLMNQINLSPLSEVFIGAFKSRCLDLQVEGKII